MSDILIRGMEMPKDQHTITITICHDGYTVVEFRNRDCYPKAIEAYEAVPLPEGHGRLIDADESIRVVWHDGTIRETTASRLLCMHPLLDLPKTVIEAEGVTDECSEN